MQKMTSLFINSADYRTAVQEFLNLLREMFDIGAEQVKPSTGKGKDIQDMTFSETVDAVQETAENVEL